MSEKVRVGYKYPLGAKYIENLAGKSGVNFAVFSHNAQKIELCIFDKSQEKTYTLNKDGDIFFGFIPNLKPGACYAYRAYGNFDPQRGDFFNPENLLFDPYSKKLVEHGDKYLSVITPTSRFNWQNDEKPNTDWSKTIIYEAHVKGFSKLFPELGDIAGTYLALAEERVIDYLLDLGITAIELLPISKSIDEEHLRKLNLSNYWGYNTLASFCVDPKYAFNPDRADEELKTAIRQLHRNGIEVIFDVVFNHSAEGGMGGNIFSQRGLDNKLWYWFDENSGYANWSGCGNSLKCDEPMVLRWIFDNLRYWVEEFHVDGFRFDLATILAREPHFNNKGKFFSILHQDPVLQNIKFIAEPWDIGDGGYQIGNFPLQFAQWNGKFRDDMRNFGILESADLGTFATRFCASSDIFFQNKESTSNSINFIAAHDGFTLADLTSYQQKHNEANGENNRDGTNDNYSANFGIEGATKDIEIINKRRSSQKFLFASLLLSAGVPMILAGDEFANSQNGNNNAYCQDNPISWIDWQNMDKDLHEYVKKLIEFRNYHYVDLYDGHRWHDDIAWFNVYGKPMSVDDWHDRKTNAMQIKLQNETSEFLFLVNANMQKQEFVFPNDKNYDWQIILSADDDYKIDYASGKAIFNKGIWILQA